MCIRDSDYTGGYSGDFTLTVDGTFGVEDCEGTAVISINPANSPQITGSLSCSHGSLYQGAGTQSGTIEGFLSGDSASGTVDFDSGITFDAAWSGSITESGPTLSGTFSGSGSFSGNADLDGDFSAERAQ